MGFRRSEYRRQFKEPSWDDYRQQYTEQVAYRTHRRQLEHHHNFVEWDWDTESEGGGGGGGAAAAVRPHPAYAPRGGHRHDHDREDRCARQERDVADREVQTPDWDPSERRDRTTRGKRRRSSAEREVPEVTPRPKTTPDRSPTRPPMLAYGWADGKRDVGCKKTFNVRASMHGDSSQVFPAALRAMRRNQYAIQYQEEQRRRENLKKRRLRATFNVPPPEQNMWMTEYQRNYTGSSTAR